MTASDSNWKDKLTSYDGKAITYDEIGNPLSYRNMTMTWQNGRQLATYKRAALRYPIRMTRVAYAEQRP